MFPLSTVLFPTAELPLHVFEERYRALLADCLAGDGEFGVVLIARGSEVGGGDERLDVGTVARIVHAAALEDGRMVVLARGMRRVRVRRWLPDDPYPRAVVTELPGHPADDGSSDPLLSEAEGSVRRLRSLLSELGDVPALAPDLEVSGTAEEIGWQLCELAPLGPVDRQALLESVDVADRMRRLAELCSAMADDVVALLAGGLDD